MGRARPERPTRAQKIFLKDHCGLNPDNWLVCSETAAEIVLEHKLTGRTRVIKKN